MQKGPASWQGLFALMIFINYLICGNAIPVILR